MCAKANSQITLVDMTDGYSVVLSNDNYTFSGNTNSVDSTQIIKCKVQALCGSNEVSCFVGEISTPEGLTIESDDVVPSPTLTITATEELSSGGTIDIPINIGDITILKSFSYSIAFKGEDGNDGSSITITSTDVAYQVSESGVDIPSGVWLKDIPDVPQGQYLWTRTTINYSDGKSTVSYSISRSGEDGSSGSAIEITQTEVSYQKSSSGTVTPTGEWLQTIPSTIPGEYLWTRTVVYYSDGKSTTSYSVSRNGVNGDNGEDAFYITIESSNGSIFTNSEINTILTAHLYKGGSEVDETSIQEYGVLNWYKDNGEEPVYTGNNFEINPGDVGDNVNYTVRLEG